jgi:hypothetical protein
MKLNRTATRQDLQTASIQRVIVKAGTALTQLAELLLTPVSGTDGPDIDKLLSMNADALALLGHATHQLSMHRRQAIKPFLNKEYATLCSPQGPDTEFLFGDEIQSQLNNIKASNKNGNTMASASPRQPTKGREHWHNKPKSPFLGGRGRQTGPPPVQTEAVAQEQILNKLNTIQVQDYVSFIPDLLHYFQFKVSHFRAGRLSSYLAQWKLLTSDDFILDLVKGAHIELLSVPIQAVRSQEKQFSHIERQIIDSEITSLLAKCVIVPSITEPGEFISPIFLTPKKDGSYRMIFNLKQFNTHVAYYHFKIP